AQPAPGPSRCVRAFVRATPHPVIYTPSLRDALPISTFSSGAAGLLGSSTATRSGATGAGVSARQPRPSNEKTETSRASERRRMRSEEHTSELQSRENLVCRLLLEKKKDVVPALALRT